MMTFPARDRWRGLPRDTAREEYFRVLQEAVTEFYLADPADPYQQSVADMLMHAVGRRPSTWIVASAVRRTSAQLSTR